MAGWRAVSLPAHPFSIWLKRSTLVEPFSDCVEGLSAVSQSRGIALPLTVQSNSSGHIFTTKPDLTPGQATFESSVS